ncbi:single-stranded-DNA-specific exonuclease RecJ [Echinimonas agarilytica]|uniref:Single-stranded-DNA-specific exonuclease RecJ n=1 Tax=Echinimonas agarilytica TaxID=1215918 RepID=A0AA41WCA1_9GAMM|nr:single-stranded-DNA-specific exonuclease RecJ [Echinimonas agarilytica]MCM2681329.1 single-stranded-DNA-specific exonuclease RecJ [Echinimonas agarilytica]
MTTSLIRQRVSPEHSLPNTIHPILQRIYSARGVVETQQIEHSAGRLEHYQSLLGMPEAVRLLADAIANHQMITIVGDFDADGATSTAVCLLALQLFGHHKADYIVPNRFDSGYGLTPPIVDEAEKLGTELLITVDNGISALAGVAHAKNKGMKVLVTDHHLPGSEIPNADAIVNPNQHGCAFPSKSLAGVGVAFYLMVALKKHLSECDWYQKPLPNLAELLDIVAVGTVADVVSLDQNNRIFVHQGLQRIRAGRARPGILALCQVAGRNPRELQASDLGFAVGPRLNAAGRLDDMGLGIQCLITNDVDAAHRMAQELDDLNKTRREIEQGMEKEALVALNSLLRKAEAEQLPRVLSLYQADWHQGVIGILASRVKDKYHRPVIAFASDDNGVLKGSARSISGVHMRDLLEAIDTEKPGLILKFGGHAMAAGLSLEAERYDEFKQLLEQKAQQWVNESLLNEEILTDGQLSRSELNLDFAQLLRTAGPWGQSFPEPVFEGRFELIQQRLVGEKHLKMVLKEESGGAIYDAIAFNIDTLLWPNLTIRWVRIAYQLDINHFRGNTSMQFLVKHIEAH